jgi:hypothetical protein
MTTFILHQSPQTASIPCVPWWAWFSQHVLRLSSTRIGHELLWFRDSSSKSSFQTWFQTSAAPWTAESERVGHSLSCDKSILECYILPLMAWLALLVRMILDPLFNESVTLWWQWSRHLAMMWLILSSLFSSLVFMIWDEEFADWIRGRISSSHGGHKVDDV